MFVDVRQYHQKALREKIAIALQKSELFNQTIAENIVWGGANEKGLQSAAQIARADSFIRKTPDGYQTMVAERGMSLSGGQKQSVSIARAVAKHAEILIFDDATSALDLKTEANLYAALNQADPGSTKIIVAQRIASVRRVDRIVVLENGKIAACGSQGRIVEQGSHEELLERQGKYHELYMTQFAGFAA